jgi:protein required for attachment to host cells
MIPSDRQGLLIIVADGARARMVRCSHDNALHTQSELESGNARKRSAELGSDHPGAAMHTGSTAHHALAPRHDPQDLEKERFAAIVADHANEAIRRGEARSLVLVAPSRTLQDIRNGLDAQAAEVLIGTLPKDLVKVPDDALSEHLSAWIPPVMRQNGD